MGGRHAGCRGVVLRLGREVRRGKARPSAPLRTQPPGAGDGSLAMRRGLRGGGRRHLADDRAHGGKCSVNGEDRAESAEPPLLHMLLQLCPTPAPVLRGAAALWAERRGARRCSCCASHHHRRPVVPAGRAGRLGERGVRGGGAGGAGGSGGEGGGVGGASGACASVLEGAGAAPELPALSALIHRGLPRVRLRRRLRPPSPVLRP